MIKKKNISSEDQKTWQNYINNPTDITDKEKPSNIKNTNRKRFKFDLHGYTLDAANKKVKEIILTCLEKKYDEILLITGKGLHSKNEDVFVSKDFGKIKYSVQEFLKNEIDIFDYIKSISVAEKKDGGEGAILIKLKSL